LGRTTQISRGTGGEEHQLQAVGEKTGPCLVYTWDSRESPAGWRPALLKLTFVHPHSNVLAEKFIRLIVKVTGYPCSHCRESGPEYQQVPVTDKKNCDKSE
jgi:hypothetical protein